MIRITTYCIKPHSLGVLLQSLAGLPATITMRHNNADDLEKNSPADILFINGSHGEIDLPNQLSQSNANTETAEIIIRNELGTHQPDSDLNVIVNGNATITNLYPNLQTLLHSYAGTLRQPEIRFRNSVFNYLKREIVFEDCRKVLSKKEAEMLRTFYLNRNNIVLKDEIVSRVWGRNDISANRSFSVYLTNLKRIIRDEESIAIRTVRGLGYIFYMDHV
jgi:hypothetical protein